MRKKSNNFSRHLGIWHRNLGIGFAVFIMLLAISGMLIHHHETLALDKRYLNHRWLLQIYGIQPNPLISYRTTHHWVSQAGRYLYLDDKPLSVEAHKLTGAIEFNQGIVAAVDQNLWLFNKEGEVLEVLRMGESLPEPAIKISYVDNRILIQGHNQLWETDSHLLEWRPYHGTQPNWAVPQNAPLKIVKAIKAYDVGHQINMERFLLDLHSGRLFGQVGVYFMDIVALGIIFLSLSGLYFCLSKKNGHN